MENQKMIDKRAILLVLPILILPFLSLAFYAFGGGKHVKDVREINTGINSALPNAIFDKDEPINKMGLYQERQQDSAKTSSGSLNELANKLGFNPSISKDPTKDIELKLQQLNSQVNAPVEYKVPSSKESRIKVPGIGSDVDRLEKLMSSLQGGPKEDQEMKQLTGMLEKVIDIQHPERVRDSYIQDMSAMPEEKFAAIPASIAEKQTLLQGTALKLILSDTVTINGVTIPKGQALFGLCNLTNQRLLVDIKTIRLHNNIIPVDLSVYGMDGIKGIAAPDAVVDNAISGGADDAVRNLQLLSLDQSIGAQVAGAGIDAAKGLFSKKVKRIKMKVKAGFPILLRDNQLKN